MIIPRISSVEELEEMLKGTGFSYDGKETMFNGVTGKKMESKIYIGNMYYLKLKYMVSNKMHARASGKVALLTRQPVEGRARGGGLRLGEMEQQALVAHGASLLLKERYDSDKVTLPICTKCGAIAIEDGIRDRVACPKCESELVVRKSFYGEFLACPGFPKCRYTESFDPKTGHFKKPKTKEEREAEKKQFIQDVRNHIKAVSNRCRFFQNSKRQTVTKISTSIRSYFSQT